MPRFSNANFASASFARAREIDAAALAAIPLFKALLRPFGAAVFLAETALASRFAAPRVRDAVPATGPFRFRFEGFAPIFFIFARMVLRAAPALDAGFLLPTRLRTLEGDASLEVRFNAVFAPEVGPVFLVFDFIVFFDLLRAAIVKLSKRDHSRIRRTLMRKHGAPKRRPDCLPAITPSHPNTRVCRSAVNLSFSTKSSKNQRGRLADAPDNGGAWLRRYQT